MLTKRQMFVTRPAQYDSLLATTERFNHRQKPTPASESSEGSVKNTQHNQCAHFLGLPREIREVVYEFLWQPKGTYRDPRGRGLITYPHVKGLIYMANKKVCEEFFDYLRVQRTKANRPEIMACGILPESITRWDLDRMFQTVARNSDRDQAAKHLVNDSTYYRALRNVNPCTTFLRIGYVPSRRFNLFTLGKVAMLVYHYTISVPHLRIVQRLWFVFDDKALQDDLLEQLSPAEKKAAMASMRPDNKIVVVIKTDRPGMNVPGRISVDGKWAEAIRDVLEEAMEMYIAGVAFVNMPNAAA